MWPRIANQKILDPVCRVSYLFPFFPHTHILAEHPPISSNFCRNLNCDISIAGHGCQICCAISLKCRLEKFFNSKGDDLCPLQLRKPHKIPLTTLNSTSVNLERDVLKKWISTILFTLHLFVSLKNRNSKGENSVGKICFLKFWRLP